VNTQMKTAQAKAQTTNDGPVLCSSWHSDATKVFTGGCDFKAKCWDLNTQQNTQVGVHTSPIKECFWVNDMNSLVTSSWDKTIKWWDTRSPTPALTVNLSERPYSMDVVFPLAVVALADRQVVIYNLANPGVEYKRITSPLKHQTRVVSCFPGKTGFAIGSIEGRVGIHHVEDKDAGDNFAFKCHRDGNDLYSVNSIIFHPTYGTFATAGADGTFNFWDKDSKQRLKPFPKTHSPISCAAFNSSGEVYAYAASYDWSKGSEYYNPATARNSIFLHWIADAEVKPRPAASTTNSRRR